MLFGIRYLRSQSLRDRDDPVSDGRALRGLRFGRGKRREAGGGRRVAHRWPRAFRR